MFDLFSFMALSLALLAALIYVLTLPRKPLQSQSSQTVRGVGEDVQKLRPRFRGALSGVAVGADATHMTVAVAQSLVQQRGFDGEHMTAMLARTLDLEPWREYEVDPGKVFRVIEQASHRLFGGVGSFGSGAAMRVAPVAMLAYSNPGRIQELARQTSAITHTQRLGLEGAVLQASAIGLLLRHSPDVPLDTHAYLAQLRPYVREPLYLEKLDRIQSLLPDAAPEDVATQLGNGAEAVQAVPAALYAFLQRPDSFTATLNYAILLGGNTGTIASMAGALAGAYLGEQAVPDVWRERIEHGVQLSELADALLHLATNGGIDA